MTGERRTRRKPWLWFALVWLGALLMLGALALPARAIAGGFMAPATPVTPGLETAAQVHTALTAHGYVVTRVGLNEDGRMAGVIMQPASRALDAAAWQQIQAGWQALADAYPQATWLLSAYPHGERYLVCFLVPNGSTPAAGQMGLYDTLLSRWVQEKDFARKDFGCPARSSVSLTPLPTASPPAPGMGPARLQDSAADHRFRPTRDRVAETITMRTEDRRRWLSALLDAVSRCEHLAPAPARLVVTTTPDLLCPPHGPSARGEGQPVARGHPRVYPVAGSESPDSSEDPTGDPPPVAQPLLVPRSTSRAGLLSPQASAPLCCLDPVPHLVINHPAIWLSPSYLLAWPTLRGRPPPRFARFHRVLDTSSIRYAIRNTYSILRSAYPVS